VSSESWVLGLDGCPSGWAGICWSGTEIVGVFRATFVSVAERATIAIENAPIAVIGVDMFVRLPDHSVQQADALARLAIGPRRSSVFTAPTRTALAATTYAEALAINREMTGRGFSAQALAMRKKALEIDRFVHALKVPLI
jgi:predicted RNase H-like nuclease